MDYAQTIEFLYHSLPAFHRVGGPAYKANLNNTLALDGYFGHPHRKFKTVHVAGTNGKGSVSHMLAAVLQQSGYRTGLYTSPHLKDFTERIRINGETIDRQEVVAWVEKHLGILDQIKPSFFEMSVAMAFDYFATNGVEVAVVEVGMGGRLDSTNIITPELSVITNISFDHTQFLGHTLPAIAGEKAGIIKTGIPVVIGETHSETREVFMAKAGEMSSSIQFADTRYRVTATGHDQGRQVFELKDTRGEIQYIQLDLLGSYQVKNIVTAVAALDFLKEKFPDITRESIDKGLHHAGSITGLHGRWEILQVHPSVICDTAHNEGGIRLAMEQLVRVPHDTLHIVFGMVKDKDPSAVLALLPVDARYYFTKAAIPRALDENLLAEKAALYGLKGHTYTSVQSAFEAAMAIASDRDVVFIGGSNFVVSEIL